MEGYDPAIVNARLGTTGWRREVTTDSDGNTVPAEGSRQIIALEDGVYSELGDGLSSQQILANHRDPETFGDGDKVILVDLNRDEARTPDGDSPVPKGAIFKIHYRKSVTETNEFHRVDAIEDYAAIETVPEYLPRDGVHEGVENRSGRTYDSPDDVGREADTLLDIYSSPIVTGSFQTWIPGWRPGQYFHVQSKLRGYFGERMFVTGVSKRLVKIEPGSLPGIAGGTAIVSTVTYSSKAVIG